MGECNAPSLYLTLICMKNILFIILIALIPLLTNCEPHLEPWEIVPWELLDTGPLSITSAFKDGIDVTDEWSDFKVIWRDGLIYYTENTFMREVWPLGGHFTVEEDLGAGLYRLSRSDGIDVVFSRPDKILIFEFTITSADPKEVGGQWVFNLTE